VPFPTVVLNETFPRFTMIGGDFESVAGQWAFRGEVAAFVRDSFQLVDPAVTSGSSIDAGFGVERKAGNYHLTTTLLFHGESADQPVIGPAPAYKERRDLSIIVSADRTFAQERYQVRAFSVYNPSEGSFFARTIGFAKLRDDVVCEGSLGWFGGDGRDSIGRFSDSDFAYLRLKYYF
jgi:hypothetical protein